MKQVIEELKTGNVRVVEQPVPRCGALQLLVQNVASLISPGTEKLMIEMGKKNLDELRELVNGSAVSSVQNKFKAEIKFFTPQAATAPNLPDQCPLF